MQGEGDKQQGNGGKNVECPHCHQVIHIVVETRVLTAVPYQQSDGRTESKHASFTDEQQKLLESARAQGILRAFETAVQRARPHEMPKDMERFLLTVLSKAKPAQIPAPALKQFIADYPQTRITFCATDGIGIVLADGVIRSFVPQVLVQGAKVGDKMRLSMDEKELAGWMKGRFGYVAFKGAFFAEMQKKSIGEFARGLVG